MIAKFLVSRQTIDAVNAAIIDLEIARRCSGSEQALIEKALQKFSDIAKNFEFTYPDDDSSTCSCG